MPIDYDFLVNTSKKSDIKKSKEIENVLKSNVIVAKNTIKKFP